MIAQFYVLASGKSAVYHGPNCRCLREHGPYLTVNKSQLAGLRPCGYCGGAK